MIRRRHAVLMLLLLALPIGLIFAMISGRDWYKKHYLIQIVSQATNSEEEENAFRQVNLESFDYTVRFYDIAGNPIRIDELNRIDVVDSIAIEWKHGRRVSRKVLNPQNIYYLLGE